MSKLIILCMLAFTTPKELKTLENACKNRGGVIRSVDHNYTVICANGDRVRLKKRIA